MLDRYVRKRGVKRSFVIERALRHHLLALAEIPEEFIVPPVIRVSDKGLREIVKMLKSPPKPTAAMRALMRRK